MSDFEKIKNWYDSGNLELYKVWNLVGKKISEEEYKTITGLTYSNKEAGQ